jgi:hypothetical protein
MFGCFELINFRNFDESLGRECTIFFLELSILDMAKSYLYSWKILR